MFLIRGLTRGAIAMFCFFLVDVAKWGRAKSAQEAQITPLQPPLVVFILLKIGFVLVWTPPQDELHYTKTR